jgi:hypothetical protein
VGQCDSQTHNQKEVREAGVEARKARVEARKALLGEAKGFCMGSRRG